METRGKQAVLNAAKPCTSAKAHVLDEPHTCWKYDRLLLSLQSALPNEHQFALNMCLAISSVDKSEENLNVLQSLPALLNTLLAHAGFYSDCGLRAIHEETYAKAFGRTDDRDAEFATFWEQVYCRGDEEEEEEHANHHLCQFSQRLLCECYNSSDDGTADRMSELEKGILLGMGARYHNKCCSGCRAPVLSGDNKSDTIGDCKKFRVVLRTKSSLSGVLVKVGERVELVAQILRNFSFEIGNADVMCNNATFLRFLLIAVHSEFQALHQIAFDIISNISKCMNICNTTAFVRDKGGISKLKSMLMNLTISKFLLSRDRFQVLRSLETITGWISSRWNWNTGISLSKNETLLKRLFDLLLLKTDTLLTVHCLECFLALTELGPGVCERIVQTPGLLKTLVAFLTTDIGGSRRNVIRTSVHLTAGLVIKNIAKHSQSGKRSLKPYEPRILEMACNDMECSWVLAKVLFYMTGREIRENMLTADSPKLNHSSPM